MPYRCYSIIADVLPEIPFEELYEKLCGNCRNLHNEATNPESTILLPGMTLAQGRALFPCLHKRADNREAPS